MRIRPNALDFRSFYRTPHPPFGHLLLKEKALVLTNPLAYMQRDPLFIVGTATGDDMASPLRDVA